MGRFLVFTFFISTLVFMAEYHRQNEYNRYKAPNKKNSVTEQDDGESSKYKTKTFYPPFKKKPYSRTTWRV